MLEPDNDVLPAFIGTPHFNSTPVRFPERASEQLGEFIGYLVGDGSFNQYNRGSSTGRLIMTVSDQQPDVAEWLLQASRHLFNLAPLAQKKENDGSTNYFLNATTLVAWLHQLGVNKPSAHDARVPALIFRQGLSMARGFLRGLFTADGTVSKDGYPSLSSVSNALIDDVQQLLLAVGIPSNVAVVTNREGAFGDSPLHRLRVATRAGLEEFARSIGFLDAPRTEVMRNNLTKAWEFNDVIPNQEKVLAATYAGPGRSRLATLAERHEEIRNSELTQFLTNDQFYDQIKSIEEDESLTLDLSVPANNTYIANGFVSHNTRRGANMGMLRVDHPDILEFIECKRPGKRTQALTNFNISVLIPDTFMQKLEKGEDYELIHPKTGTNLDPDGRSLGKLNSRELWDKLVHGAWETGDPGVVFLDRLERDNPTPHIGKLECTNPCGEQPLLPYEACNLGSLNIIKYVEKGADGKKQLNLQRLAADSKLMTRFLDDVIQSSWYALPELFDMVHGNRKIGVGVMGYGDALIDMEIPYDSEEALTVAEDMMKTIHLATVDATRDLGKERGAFPNFKGSTYEMKGEPVRRNALTTTIAPTGTIGLLADAVCAGVEPLFAVAYMRTTADGIRLPYVHPAFEAVAREEGWYSPELMEKIASVGHVRGLPEVPEKWQKVFVTAHEVLPEWHVRTQATCQKWTDNAVSKTVNFGHDAAAEDVERVYKLAYETGCKGVTIFRDGSLDTQVLTIGTKDAVAKAPAIAAPAGSPAGDAPVGIPTAGNGMRILPGTITQKMEIPDERAGYTKTLQTPFGKMHITVNEVAKGLPVEVFTTIGKAGSDITADAEAIGRLISLALQLGGHVSLITHTLRGIGGSSTVGFGPNRVTSMPDAIAKFLEQKYLQEEEQYSSGLSLGICPECGKAAVVPEMGCATCKECGWKAC
ncbi:MAG: adenosylcobalamin-dependent ribonucleoside-diphosphate reductase [Symbiobacteriia bacterium]